MTFRGDEELSRLRPLPQHDLQLSRFAQDEFKIFRRTEVFVEEACTTGAK